MTDYEVIDHGWDHAQYFPGCGVAWTPFGHCVTGAGHSPAEALADAAEQAATAAEPFDLPESETLSETTDIDCECWRTDECEHWHYVSIRWGKR